MYALCQAFGNSNEIPKLFKNQIFCECVRIICDLKQLNNITKCCDDIMPVNKYITTEVRQYLRQSYGVKRRFIFLNKIITSKYTLVFVLKNCQRIVSFWKYLIYYL